MKKKSSKPRICFALPGIHYTPQSPYIRSTLPMVPYLQEHFDIVLVYRKILTLNSKDHIQHKFLTILEPDSLSKREKRNTHPYFEPQHYPALLQSKSEISRFAERHAEDFDLVFEKEWPWLGALTHEFSKRGTPTSMLIEAMYKRPPAPDLSLPKKAASIGLQSLRLRKREVWSREVNS